MRIRFLLGLVATTFALRAAEAVGRAEEIEVFPNAHTLIHTEDVRHVADQAFVVWVLVDELVVHGMACRVEGPADDAGQALDHDVVVIPLQFHAQRGAQRHTAGVVECVDGEVRQHAAVHEVVGLGQELAFVAVVGPGGVLLPQGTCGVDGGQ